MNSDNVMLLDRMKNQMIWKYLDCDHIIASVINKEEELIQFVYITNSIRE